MSDTALQRKNMVESQIRPSDVTDRRITAAMSHIPRERFVPAALAELAYLDGSLALGAGRSLLAPRDLAKLLQLAAIEEADKVLVVGTAPAYAAAVAATIGYSVVALDADAAAARDAQAVLDGLGLKNAQAVSGPLAEGFAAGAPYDVIVVEGQIDTVPPALKAQMTASTRLVAVENDRGVPRAVLLQAGHGAEARTVAFEAAAPRLSGFAKPEPAFRF